MSKDVRDKSKSNYNSLYELFKVDKDLVTDFFVFFARFECALKVCGKYTNHTNRIGVDWNTFSKENNKPFMRTMEGANGELASAVTYLKEHAPKKQVASDGKLEWKPAQNPCADESELKNILLNIRRVRNNLFHGGKFSSDRGGPVDEIGRDKKLLESCLVVMKVCIELNAEVKKSFWSKS